MSSVNNLNLILSLLIIISIVQGLVPSQNKLIPSPTSARTFKSISGQRWGEFDGFQCQVLEKKNFEPNLIFENMGDIIPERLNNHDDEAKNNYNLNVGRALEALRRELPIIFFASNLDFSIFANQILVND